MNEETINTKETQIQKKESKKYMIKGRYLSG